MKGARRQLPMFSCDWQCYCGSMLGLKVPVAVVQSQTGAMVPCKCGLRYKVTEAGALPITEERKDVKVSRPLPVAVGHTGDDIGREIPVLRFPQPGGERKQRSANPPVWAMRMPQLRDDTQGMGEPTGSPGSTR